jgi:hypothetical protein
MGSWGNAVQAHWEMKSSMRMPELLSSSVTQLELGIRYVLGYDLGQSGGCSSATPCILQENE